MNDTDLNNKGRVTLPAQAGMEEEVLQLARKWGADAVRDSDGTKLSGEIMKMGFEVYSTLCLIREDPAWTAEHRQYLQCVYLMSQPVVAVSETLEIDLTEHCYKEQLEIDTYYNPNIWWEVTDRTDGRTVDSLSWIFMPEKGRVKIYNAYKWHRYTVSFLARQIWEPVSMYNHITNSWEEEHKMPLDPRYPEARAHLLEVLDRWLSEHTDTDVVRFTTFFYNFDLIYDEKGRERQVDWFGYLSCVSPHALKQFKYGYGYRLAPEDFIDNGYYNSPFRVPSKRYLDWMDFNQRFVAGLAKECVEHVHRAGKKAIMFLGDHWAGTEPYGKYFEEIGLDAVVGAAGDGVTTRMISDIPVKATEARFYPYFFPDVFHKGGSPEKELLEVWRKSRRALLRKPTDRMGYGGYLSLVLEFPGFTERVAGICEEFRAIHTMSGGTKPCGAPFKVAVLNAWGRIRSWMTHQVAHSLWNRRCYSYLGVLEALSGLPFDVIFISFDDIREKGIPEDTGVIINTGDAGTAWSGGDLWKDERLTAALREWVYNGGGFIGVGEPSACEYGGTFFQLPDVLGVQKETGFSLNHNKQNADIVPEHFITADLHGKIDFGEGTDSVYKCGETAQVLAVENGSCSLAVNTYGRGRAVYAAGLPFNTDNTRLLLRAIYWASGRESGMLDWYSTNPELECAAFPGTNRFAVINNSYGIQKGYILKPGGKMEIEMQPLGCRWFEISPETGDGGTA